MQRDIDLKTYNTFGIDSKAKYFIDLRTEEEAINFFKETNLSDSPFLILGGGSNILLTKDFNGIVIKNSIQGISIESEDDENISLKVGAGENWHEFVLHTIDNTYYGIENLSLIPGCIGASPMQNIGAYGVEVKNVIQNVHTIDINSGKERVFRKEECEFGYRTSTFKTKHKNKYFITSVEFKLSKRPIFHLDYGAIKEELERMNIAISEVSLKNVSDAVIAIRKSKLPDPKEIGNAGSFFKNPIVNESFFQYLKNKYKSMPAYKLEEGKYKLAAGWLIEQGGWKGFREDDFGVHKNQALVLVNFGESKGSDILMLSERIIESIKQRFGVTLEREVNIV